MKKLRLSFMAKVFLMAVIPALIVCVFMGGGTFVNLKKNMVMEIKNTLRATAYSLNYDDTQERLNGYKDTLGIDVTVFHDNIREVTTVEGSVNTEADASIYAEVKKGNEYFSEDANVNGHEYFGYYIPMYDAEHNFAGMTFAGKPTAEANEEIYSSIVLMIASASALVIAVFVVIILIVRKMAQLLKNSTDLIKEVSNGNFTVRADKKAPNDEIGNMYRQVGSLATALQDSFTEVKATAQAVSDVSDELAGGMSDAANSSNEVSEAIQNIAHGAESQSQDAQNITVRIEEMGQQIDVIRECMNFLTDTSTRMLNMEEDTIISVGKAENENGIIKSSIEEVNSQIDITSRSMEEIKDFVDVIKDIAEQTNLLSLNASIEAAHAGEHGRGFAVVAEEIRKLAEQSADAAENVERKIGALTGNYAAIIKKMTVTTENIASQSRQIADTKEAFTSLDCDIKDTAGQIRDIATATAELDKMKEQIVDSICSLSAVSEENSASTEQTTASMEELDAVIQQGSDRAKEVKERAKALIDDVSVFKV